MHEIITLQFGQQSNYLGTHYWNAQESYFTYDSETESPVNHDVSFRQGVGADGSDTYLPRTVIYDFKTSFGTLRRFNELYEVLGDNQQSATSWGGNISAQILPSVAPNEYQRSLNEGSQTAQLTAANVRFWSDYSRVYYHPRSIVQIYESEINPERRSFDDWQTGEDLFAQLDAEHDLLDRDLRPFVEECDQMQGLQVFSDVGSAWGAFTSRYIERVRDELGKVPIHVWALSEGRTESTSRRSAELVNAARALFELSTQSSLYVPVSVCPTRLPQYLALDVRSPWHTAALQMTAIESFTLPSRLVAKSAGSAATLDSLSTALSPAGDRKIVELGFEVPGTDSSLSMQESVFSTSSAVQMGCNLFPADRDPTTEDGIHVFNEIETYRGAQNEPASMNGNGNSSGEHHDFKRFQTHLQFPLLDSFPHIYPQTCSATHSLPVRAQAQMSTSVAAWVRAAERVARRRFGVEDRETLSNGLQEIAEAYNHGFDDGDEDWYD